MVATNREEQEHEVSLGNKNGPDLTLQVTRFLRTDTISCFVAELVVAITAILVVERDDRYLLASSWSSWSSPWSSWPPWPSWTSPWTTAAATS